MSSLVDIEQTPGNNDDDFVPANQSQAKVHALLNDETVTIYHKVDDPVYESFRENVRLRDEFNNHISTIDLNDRVKIWRTHRNIEEDCKARLLKYE